jgi:hypothetical protein
MGWGSSDPGGMGAFALVKWYLDCVDDDGRSAILYSSTLTWGPASVSWHGISLHEPGRAAVHRSSLASIPLPERQGADLVWRAPPLGCTVVCTPALAPIARRLIDRPEGAVDWRCEMPAASIAVALPDRPTLAGHGYAERLEMTVLPWRLPIDELRWGRWISDDGGRSLVWIDWTGPQPRTDVYLDGQPRAGATVARDRVETGGASLDLSDRRALHSRPVASALNGLSPILSRLPSAWRRVEDAKWISRARLRCPGAPAEGGWCIDEVVRFPR